MRTFEIESLLDRSFLAPFLGDSTSLISGVYDDPQCSQYRSVSKVDPLFQEIVRLQEGAILTACETKLSSPRIHHELMKDSDWVHVQFHLFGSGSERWFNGENFETPENTCIIARYPESSRVERITYLADCRKVICLWMRPDSIARLLDVSKRHSPEDTSWIFDNRHLDYRHQVLPLRVSMSIAINDIFRCRLRGEARRTYMRAKSIELMSIVMSSMQDALESHHSCEFQLTERDVNRVTEAYEYICANVSARLSLGELARHVGLNRTKLAVSFKQVYGTTVQAMWNDIRLIKAKDILSEGHLSVSETARHVGYQELASFTRAFQHKFGVSPKNVRRLTRERAYF